MHNFDEYIFQLEKTSPTKNRFWFALDNAAKIFPAIISEEIPVVFRLTAVLKHPVKVDQFRKAVLIVEKRFPYYKVQLKEGFFWFYLEHLPKHIPVELDEDVLCRKFQRGEVLVRFLVRGKQDQYRVFTYYYRWWRSYRVYEDFIDRIFKVARCKCSR